MAKYVCAKCGKKLQSDYPVCPYCKAARATQTRGEPQQSTKAPKKKKKRPVWAIALAVLIAIGIVGSAFGGGDSDEERTESNPPQQSATQSKEQNQEENKPSPKINHDLNVSDYLEIDAEVLFEYGNYMPGKKVVTVITIKDIGRGLLKANTENNDSLFFSINCEFEDPDYPKQFNEGDMVTVAGITSENLSPVGDTVVLSECSVIGLGEIADDLKAGETVQRELCEGYKAEHEQAIASTLQAEKDAYISQCVSVKYSDVERNPDNYDGQKIKFSGKVVQVSEGFLDSVTLRVNSNGNMWYVTYSRKDGESRILEGDNITCYGECNGVTSYTNVLGSQVTIPSMRMEYYN